MAEGLPPRVIPKPLPVLKGFKVHFAEGHLYPPALDILKGYVSSHEGTIVDDRQHATHLIVHPGCVKYKEDESQARVVALQYPGLTQPKFVPYHWLCQVQLSNSLIDIDSLQPPLPIFFHPAISEHNKPLIAWVSVNVQRHTDEADASVAQLNVEKELQMGGAVCSNKRSRADLLIVDQSTNFAQKVKAERIEHKRFHQKLAERDWVDDCARNRKLSWHSAEEEMKEDNEDMTRDMNKRGKGPGRPTGLPRNEYTDADDEFLARYLAYYHRTGSWSSRKTYEDMLNSPHPEAQNHSMESWLNRFKKNQVRLEKRIDRALKAGLDKELKTSAERKSAEERRQAADKKKAAVKPEAAPSNKGSQGAKAVGDGTPSKAGKGKDTTAEGSSSGLSEKHVDTYKSTTKAKARQLVEMSESSIESAKSQNAAAGPSKAKEAAAKVVASESSQAGESATGKPSEAPTVAATTSQARNDKSRKTAEPSVEVQTAVEEKQAASAPAAKSAETDGKAAEKGKPEGQAMEAAGAAVVAGTAPESSAATQPSIAAKPTSARNDNPNKAPSSSQKAPPETSESSASRTVPVVQASSTAEAAVAATSTHTAAAAPAADESETQALLSDFRRPGQPAPRPLSAKSAPIKSAETSNAATGGTTSSNQAARAKSPAPPADTAEPSRPAAPIPAAEPGESASRVSNVKSPLPKSKNLPPPPRSVMRPPRPTEPVPVPGTSYTLQDQGNGYTRLTAQLEARVVEVASDAPAPPPQLQVQPTARAGNAYQTPSPGRALAHGNGTARRESEHDIEQGSAKRSRLNRDYSPGPDTVYATPNLPPPRAVSVSRSVIEDFADFGGLPPTSALARGIQASETARARRLARASSAASASVSGIPGSPATAPLAQHHVDIDAPARPLSPSPPPRISPPLSHAERTQSIMHGKAVVDAAKMVYRQRIIDLGDRYGIGLAEVHRAIDALKKQKGGGVYRVGWDELRRGLDEVFGYSE